MARVVLEGVSKQYPGGVTAIESLSLVVEPGELVVLVGPSGSGKTTVLRLIAGLERPSTGQVWLGGREVTQLAPHERNVALVLQSCPLYPHLNVLDNIALGGRMRHATALVTQFWRRCVRPRAASENRQRVEQSPRIREAAERLGIGHLLERWPRQLSGGERQRVALARAFVREPAAFLFDEPLSSLDAGLRTQLRRTLHHLQRDLKVATLYVTHDQAEAMTLGDRLVVLDKGRVQQIGTPEELYKSPANRFVAGFLGSPPMNILPGRLAQAADGWRWEGAFGALPVEESLASAVSLASDESTVQWGARPEAVRWSVNEVPAHAWPAEVRIVEWLGDCQQVTLAPLGGRRDEAVVVAKLPVTTPCRVGERGAWWVEKQAWHWFETASGQRLGSSKTRLEP